MRNEREVVVITGASAGVGRATVREFAKRGAAIGLIARGREGLEGARREVEALGGQALVLPLDVADAEAVEAAAERVERELGPIDVWVNDAMVTVLAPVSELSAEDVRRVTEVTYLGVVNGTLAALRRFRRRDRGTIVQVGSALAYRAIPLQAAYCGAKFAIRGFTETLRTELLHEKSRVHVTMVQLPGLNTPQFTWCKTTLDHEPQPMPPVYQPEVAARAIHWAAHTRRREVWVGRASVRTILGNRLAPWFVDRVLARKGYDAQQTPRQLQRDPRGNLHEPIPGDRGAHGPFDERAESWSPQLWATRNRGWLVGAGALLVAVAGGVALARALREPPTRRERAVAALRSGGGRALESTRRAGGRAVERTRHAGSRGLELASSLAERWR